MCLKELNEGVPTNSINITLIVLIPEVNASDHMSQFRPINLCYVIYKMIAKVMANMLNKVLKHITSPSWEAYIRQRIGGFLIFSLAEAKRKRRTKALR